MSIAVVFIDRPCPLAVVAKAHESSAGCEDQREACRIIKYQFEFPFSVDILKPSLLEEVPIKEFRIPCARGFVPHRVLV